jgi:hypothetical protein
MDRATAAVMVQSKSVGLAFVLSLFFGGLGLFYASVQGGIIITGLQILSIVITFFTFGVGIVLFPLLHFVAVVWSIIASQNHNKALIARL